MQGKDSSAEEGKWDFFDLIKSKYSDLQIVVRIIHCLVGDEEVDFDSALEYKNNVENCKFGNADT